MASLFQLPNELLTALFSTFPCREAQIRSLATLVYPLAAPCRNLVIHGTEATGKSAVTAKLLEQLKEDPDTDINYAIVTSPECVTARHLFERTVGAVADALQWQGAVGRCETLAALTVGLSKMLKYVERDEGWRFVLVFDSIDRQREAPPTLLPALARLSEIIPNLSTIFILTSPSPSLLRVSSTPHLQFPPYTKPQYITIVSASPPAPLPNTTAQETADLYARFVAAIHDSLTRPVARTLPSLQRACTTLWPRFTAPIAAGTHKAREFSKLLIAARAYLSDESVLAPSIVQKKPTATGAAGKPTATTTDLAVLLPPTAKLLLVAAYLASHNAPRHDQTLFSTWHHGRRRRGGGTVMAGRRTPRSKHRKIARKLLGPSIFTLERMVAIYAALRREFGKDNGNGMKGYAAVGVGVDSDAGMAIATLSSLRLLVRVGGAGAAGGDMDRGGRWRVGVGWEIVKGVGRSLGIEVEEWLVE